MPVNYIQVWYAKRLNKSVCQCTAAFISNPTAVGEWTTLTLWIINNLHHSSRWYL